MNKITENSNLENFGLYHGKMGYCLSYFMRAKISKDKADKKYARKFLNEIGENIGIVEDYSFENGLLGIGWAIEWIAQQKYLKIDTNTVLADLDDEVYKLVMYSEAEDIGLIKGTLGRVLYLYKRISTKTSQMDFYKETSLYEVLTLAVDELYEAINEKYLLKPMFKNSQNIRIAMSQCLIMLAKLKPLKFSYLVDDLLNKLTSFFEALIDDLVSANDIWNYRLEIRSYYNAGLLLNNKMWINQIKYILKESNVIECQFLSETKYSFKRSQIFQELSNLSNLTNDYSWQEGWLLR